MPTRDELRSALWRARDWTACARQLAAKLSAMPVTPNVADAAALLARALEAIDPDRRQAIAMYLLAWIVRPKETQHLARARQLCREIGDLERAADLARREYDSTGNALLAVEEGLARLDAGDLERAAAALAEARRSRPRDQGLAIALATARRDWDDPRPVVRELMGRAEEMPPGPGGAALLSAARIVRAYGYEGDDYGGVLRRAFAVDPSNDRVYGLLESWLLGRGDRDGLLETYRRRAEATADPAALVEEYRRAGTRLVTGCYQTGLGLRLLERSVATAYDAGLTAIPGHIASLSLMRARAEEANLAASMLELIARGVELDLPDHDRLWLSLTGLELAWKGAGDAAVARAYAARVAELAPAHPILQELMVDQGVVDAPWSAPEPDDDDDEFVFLDQWGDGAASGPPQAWGVPERVGLAAAESPDALQLDAAAFPIEDDSAIVEPLELSELIDVEDAPEAIPIEIDGPDDDSIPIELDESIEIDLAAEPAESAAEPTPAPAPKPPVGPLIPSTARDALAGARTVPLVPAKPTPPPGAVVRAPRRIVPTDVRLLEPGSPPIAAVTRDLSETGLFLVTEADLAIGAALSIELELPGDHDFAVTELTLTARVVRKAPEGYGLVFVDPPAEARALLGTRSG